MSLETLQRKTERLLLLLLLFACSIPISGLTLLLGGRRGVTRSLGWRTLALFFDLPHLVDDFIGRLLCCRRGKIDIDGNAAAYRHN